MADVAELHIKPRLISDVSGDVRRISTAVEDAHRHQMTMIGQGERGAEQLRRAYGQVSHAIGTIGRETGRAVSSLFSLRNAVTGVIAGTAGRTIIESTIGSADEMTRNRRLMGLMLNDASLVAQAEQRAIELTSEISSLSRAQAVTGMRTLMRMADNDVDRAAELLRIAKALEATSPEQGFEGAMFALQELETGDTMSLRSRFRMRMPTRAEAEGMADEAGQTLQEFYFERLQNEMDTRYGGGQAGAGVTNLLAVDSESLRGQWGMIKTIIQDALGSIGEAARETLSEELPAMIEELREYMAGGEFLEDARAMGEFLADAAKGVVDMARALPGVINDLKTFFKEHETLIRVGGMAMGANFLTGGLVGRAAGGLIGGVGRGVGSLLGGRGTGGSMGLPGGMGGATPVYVVNMGAGGMMGGAGAMGGGSMIGGTAGRIGMGMGGTAALAGGVIFGSMIAAVVTLGEVFEGTSDFVHFFEREAREREQRAIERDRRMEELQIELIEAVQEQTGGVETPGDYASGQVRGSEEVYGAIPDIVTLLEQGGGVNSMQARVTLEDIFGGRGAEWTGSEQQTAILGEVNAALAPMGISVQAPGRGRQVSGMRFESGYQYLPEEEREAGRQMQETIQRVAIDPQTGDPLYPNDYDEALSRNMRMREVETEEGPENLYNVFRDQSIEREEHLNEILGHAQEVLENANVNTQGLGRSRYVGVNIENLTVTGGQDMADQVISEADQALLGQIESGGLDNIMRQAEALQ